jgi:small redox-active disulfide protein 2
MKIIIAGPGCPKCHATEKNVREACSQMKILAEITHVTDVREIGKLGVMLTPALVIEGKVVSSGRVPEVDEVKKSLTTQG